MSSVLTNRLVGSAILIIAAVVFLPDLLDGQKEIRKDDFKAIPERPEFAKVTEPADINAAQHQAAQQAAQQLPTDPEPQQLDGSGITPTGQPTEPTATTTDMAGGQAAVTTASPGTTQPAGVPPTAGQQAGEHATQSTSAPGNSASNNAVSSNAVPNNATAGKTGTVQTGTMEKPLSVESAHSDPLAAEAAAEQSAVAGKPAAQDKSVATTTEPVIERVTTPAVPAGQAAFVVKVGSFGKSQNAEQLVGKLKAAGFPAFTRKIRTAQGTEMVSVMVGPELKKARLEAQLPQLQALVQIPGLKVIGYQVVENN